MSKLTQQRPGRRSPARLSLTARLSSAELSAAERRVVEYCLSVPEHQLTLMTAERLARRAGSSRSTVERVTRRFGFKGVRAFAAALQQESSGSVSEVELDPAISMDDGPATIAKKVLMTASIRARKFAETLAADDSLNRLIDWMHGARSVVLFGAGISSAVAMDLHHRLLRLGLEVKYMEDTQTQYALAALMKKGDLGILVSYSGRTASTIRTARIGRERGARLVAITGQPRSLLAELCDLSIVTPGGVGLFGNDAALTRMLQIMFNEILFHCLAVKDVSRLTNTRRIDEILAQDKEGMDLRRRPARKEETGKTHGR